MYDTRQPWFVSLLQTFVVVAISYFVAVFMYLVLIHTSELPHGPLWNDSLRAPFAFILIVLAAGIMLVPYFQKEWDRGLRMFSLISALFLLAYTALGSSGYLDPNVPLRFITQYVMEPLRRILGF